MEILSRKEVKKLQELFSWAQFYMNSVKSEDNKDGLAISRYPRHYYFEKGKRIMYIPYNDQKRYDKCQEEIKKIGNK